LPRAAQHPPLEERSFRKEFLEMPYVLVQAMLSRDETEALGFRFGKARVESRP